MSKTKVNYAIIGFGGIAENRIAKEGFARDRKRFRSLPGVELIGAADISPRRRKGAERLGLKWYESPEAALADPAVDAVFVASNNASHFPLGKKALKSGKHVILEKPMATGLAEARTLTALAARKKLSISVDHMMVHNAYNRKAREFVAQGTLGKVNDICLHMEFYYGFAPEEAVAWRCADPAELGGPIGDVGSHCLYMAEFLMGSQIQSVAAVFTPRTLKIRAENGALIRFRMENGLSGSVRVSFNDPRGNLESTILNLGYEIYGTERTLRAYGTLFQLSGHRDEPVKIRLDLEGDETVEVLRLANVRNIYQQIILEHAQSVRSGSRLTGEDGLHNLRLVLAAYRSAAQGGKEIKVI
jgi:1,5-anhydro-D-fructose reductase (1,5-anhydro-D-mannitol-forming)